MLMCRVEGSATSTIRHPSLQGWRLLICQPLSETGEDAGLPILCLDDLGAGEHQLVIVTSDGKSVSERVGHRHTPARYMILAIVDETECLAGKAGKGARVA